MTTWVGDIEANGFLEEVDTIHCAVYKNIDTKEVVKFTPDNIEDMLGFLDTVDTVIGHNFIQYDLKVIEKIYGYRFKGKVYDTLVLSRTLNDKRRLPPNCPNTKARPHGLEAWGYRVGRGKPDHSDWMNYSPEMLHRCSEDVEINELVYYALQDEMVYGDWSRAVPMTMKLFQVFDKIEDYGWKVDKEWMHICVDTLETEIDNIDTALHPQLPWVREDKGEIAAPFLKSGGYKVVTKKWFEDSSPTPEIAEERMEAVEVGGPFCRVLYRRLDLSKRKEVIKLLLDEGWEPEAWNTNDAGEQTSPKLSKDDPFHGIEGDLGSEAARRVQVRHRLSLINGLFKLIRPDGRIASRIAGLAETSRVRHAGIVNIPNVDSYFGEEIRRIFIADEGKVLVGVDSAGNQVRQLTSLMGDDAYEYEVLHGDIHEANRIAAGLPTRSNAKTFFYGFLFGAGDEKVGSIVGGGAAAGRQLKTQFLEGLPKLGELLSRLTEEWRVNAKKRWNRKWSRWEYYDGWVAGLDGRPIHIKSEHAILVYVLQNMEAIQMSYALLFSYKWLIEAGLKWGDDFGIVCFYHDEINTECKPEYAELIGETVKKAIIHAGVYLNIKTPHDGDIKIGDNWYEVH